MTHETMEKHNSNERISALNPIITPILPAKFFMQSENKYSGGEKGLHED